MKHCSRCKTEKPITEFHPNPKMASGLNSWCKECGNEATKLAKAKKKGAEWALQGYKNETEHFNAALEHYAEIFNCPALLKHKI